MKGQEAYIKEQNNIIKHVDNVKSELNIPQSIGKTVRVYLAMRDVEEGVFMDNRGYDIPIRTINNKYVGTPCDKIVYVEEM